MRFNAGALAALSRIFAREAAMKVASEGMRWLRAAAAAPELDKMDLERKSAWRRSIERKLDW